MNLKQCKIRKIDNSVIQTPTFVSSFSSKAFVDVGVLHKYLKENLTEASLISAYDLYYKRLSVEDIFETEVIFIDSGGYESVYEHDLSEIYGLPYQPEVWNRELYLDQICKIEPLTTVVLVNYDSTETKSIEDQIEHAKECFRRFPFFTSDFLLKPCQGNLYIDINVVCSKITHFSDFSILGFTEKELGSSVLERCKGIYKIRSAMTLAGMDQPIHVFGCIDPLNSLLFCLCGADIFDGLSWLRFAFKDNVPIYFNHWAISNDLSHLDISEVKALAYVNNLNYLDQLKCRLMDFSLDYDWSKLQLDEKTTELVKKILLSVMPNKGG